MPTFLSDPTRNLYLLLLVAVVVATAIWLQSRRRNALIAMGVSLGLLLTVYLIDRAVESPREQAIRKMQELAEATQKNDGPNITKQFSEQFRYGSTTRNKVAERFATIRNRWSEWKGGVVWGFDRDGFQEISETQFKIGFSGQAKDYPQTVRYIVATFQRDPDGEWRISKVQFYDPLQKDRGAEQIISELGN
jgi:hypothetical protein